MRINLLHTAVGCPARMRNAQNAWHRRGIQVIAEVNDFADLSTPLHSAICLQNRQSGRVIASVFQSLQALYQYGRYISFCYRTNYATHAITF
jgi:hypothetical protein